MLGGRAAWKAGSARRCGCLLRPGRSAGAAPQSESETLAAQAAELFAPADPQGDAVQMMTIHKSKGLEFDTVILPGLHRETGGGDSNLLLWDEVAGADGDEHLLVAPMRQKGSDGRTDRLRHLRRLEGERAAHETERLLYVAATRPFAACTWSAWRLPTTGRMTASNRRPPRPCSSCSGRALPSRYSPPRWTGVDGCPGRQFRSGDFRSALVPPAPAGAAGSPAQPAGRSASG
jgi:hypothetical protein